VVERRSRLIEAAMLSGKRAGSSARDARHLIGAERGFNDALSLRDIDALSLRDGGMLHGRMIVRACRCARTRLRVGTHGCVRLYRGHFPCFLRGVSRRKSSEITFDKIRRRAGVLRRPLRCIERAKRIVAALDRIGFRVGALARIAHKIGGKRDGMRRFS
jgi:hypothetical protein